MTSNANGAVLWIPPRSGGSNRFMDELDLRYTLLRVSGRNHGRVREAIRLIQQNEPEAQHLELRILAVDPDVQGRGIARALMRPMLERCDVARLPVALECTKQQNVAFYEHFGFSVTNEIAIANGPRLWGMWREPS